MMAYPFVELVSCAAVFMDVGSKIDSLRRFRDNVEMLREKKEDLEMKRSRLQRQIEEAENQLHVIGDDVRDLLSRADAIFTHLRSMEEEIEKDKIMCCGAFPNFPRRYRLIMKIKKGMRVISDLLEKMDKFAPLEGVGYSLARTISTFELLSSDNFMVFKASKKVFSQIIEALKDDNVSIIALWGVGGLGKTTLVRHVGKEAKESNLFDRVIISTVSQRPNFRKIQDDIAKELGFDMNPEQRRRSETELWMRLKKEKKMLIIFEDVWEEINLRENIGIPLGEDHQGCKVLLTTTRLQVCRSMECQKVVQLGFLDDKEAGELFEKKAGIGDAHDAIKELAGQIVKKCEGLPSAIVTLANSLKDNTNRHMWEATYQRLQSRRLVDTEGINNKNAYQCLEVCFDYLKSRETKLCFLLCSLFPQDYEIYVEDLVRFAWGLELYKGVVSIEEVRSEVLAAVDVLKNSSLLLDSGEKHVKMHSFVREVALWIASSRKEISFSIKSEVVQTWLKDESFEPYRAIYIKTSRIDKLPKGLVCPNLNVLSLGGDDDGEFLEENKELKVCSLDDGWITPETCQVRSLRLEWCKLLDISTLGKLTNLRTLLLECCQLPDISALGNLKKLHVLSLSGSKIEELPAEIGDLNDLKLLDLSDCSSLKRILPHLIQRLSKLEELYLHNCRSIKWATKNATPEKSYGASLSELNSMQNLTVLSLQVAPVNLPKEFAFRRLHWYDVCIDEDILLHGGGDTKKDSQNCPIMRSLKIEASVIDACKQLLRDVESLNMKNLLGYENLVPRLELKLELDHQGFNKLTSLGLESCRYMKCLIDTTNQHAVTTAFSNLVNLSLIDLPELEKLCNGIQPQGFLQNLKTLSIQNCEGISAIPIPQNLERLQVTSCDGIRVLFQNAELGRLKIVQIKSCNNLTYLFPATIANSLGQLETLKIENCSVLKAIIQEMEVMLNINLQNLTEVYVRECNTLTYLFPATSANCLGQLETLKIENCSVLKDIIQEKEIMSNINLQSLREVCVQECNNLTSLSSLSHGYILKSLTSLHISSCTGLEYIFPTSVAEHLPQLNEIRLEKLSRLDGRVENNTVLRLPSLQKLTVTSCPKLTPFTISAKVQELWFEGMKETKQSGSMEIVPESTGSSQNMEYLTIANFEELFDAGYNLLSLKQLRLWELAELQVVWKGPILVECFQNLSVLDFVGCGRLKYIFSPTIAQKLLKLSSLSISGCDELVQIIGKDETSSEEQAICFPNLTSIKIESCANLRSLFPVTVAHGLPKLKRLVVRSVSKLEKVFIEKGDEASGSEDREKVTQLPKLDTLRLEVLPNLQSFSPMDYHFVLPSLLELEVRRCPNITTRFSFDSKKWGHAITKTIGSIDENIVEEYATPQGSPELSTEKIDKD